MSDSHSLGMPAPSFTSHQLREARAEAISLAAKNERLVAALTAEPGGQSPGGNDPDDGSPEPGPDDEPGAEIRNDPIALLARAAGYDDPEAWWEDTIEFPGAGAERRQIGRASCRERV